jgi:hypothetical protein
MVRFSVSSSRRPATAWAQMRRSKGSRVQVRSVAAPTTSENGVVLTRILTVTRSAVEP